MDKTKAEKEKERRKREDPTTPEKKVEILSILRCGAEVLDAAKFIRKKSQLTEAAARIRMSILFKGSACKPKITLYSRRCDIRQSGCAKEETCS